MTKRPRRSPIRRFRAESVRALTRRAAAGLLPEAPPYWRPRTRGDCEGGFRPCPFVGCRYHLATDTTRYRGIHTRCGDDVERLREMPDTCALDVAERGEHDLADIAPHFDLTLQMVSYIIIEARRRLLGHVEEDLP